MFEIHEVEGKVTEERLKAEFLALDYQQLMLKLMRPEVVREAGNLSQKVQKQGHGARNDPGDFHFFYCCQVVVSTTPPGFCVQSILCRFEIA